jgi:hypothetical protein
MRQKSVPDKEPATQVVKNIRRAMRRHFSAEDKIRIVLEGPRGETAPSEIGISKTPPTRHGGELSSLRERARRRARAVT